MLINFVSLFRTEIVIKAYQVYARKFIIITDTQEIKGMVQFFIKQCGNPERIEKQDMMIKSTA